jgi:hypothetical protein
MGRDGCLDHSRLQFISQGGKKFGESHDQMD